jgi:hypothetical protein
MQSILTVVTPATSQDLTLLATVKAELGISGSTEDTAIETWIDQASAACSAYCNRVFGRETVTQQFRRYNRVERSSVLVLDRFPVTSFTSVVEDGVTLVNGTDYECDLSTGLLYRLSASDDSVVAWDCDKLTVTYVGGFALLGDLPATVERACISMVKLLRASATRDPALRSENILSGLYSYTLFGPSDMGPGGLPNDVEALLAPYRVVSV